MHGAGEMTEREQMIADQRAMLDWLEEHPEVDVRFSPASMWYLSDSDKDKFFAAAKAMGEYTQTMRDVDLLLTKHFGSARFQASIAKDIVCQKRTKTATVEEWYCPELEDV
jgi:hypothetical protein